MTTQWEDKTSYSRGDKDRTPRIWRLKTKHMGISVHRHVCYEPDVWLLSSTLYYDCYTLKNKDAEKAKEEALTLVFSKVKEDYDVMREMIGEIVK